MSERPPSPQSPRSKVVDLWRAFACLAVVAFHARGNYFADDLHPSIVFLNRLAEHGHLGVTVFFVISGYCLAEAIERRSRRDRGDGLLAFWQDRVLRIFPAYWAALALSLVLALASLPFNHLPPASVVIPSASFWLANVALATEWHGLAPFLAVSWSLDYEIGFYLLVGLALVIPSARSGISARLTGYCVLTAICHLPGASSYFPLLALWPAFASGIAIRFALDPALPLVVRAGILTYPLLLPLLGEGGLPTTLFTLAILGSLVIEPRLPAPPRLLLGLGAASYSIYLVHVPFMSAAANLARRFVSPASPAYLVVWSGQIVIGITVGLVFFAAIERPCERLRARLRLRRSP